MNRLWERFLDLLFPPKCVFCRALLAEHEGDLCARCRRELPWISGQPSEQKQEFIALAVCPLWYEDAVRASFHRYKFHGRTCYAGPYGRLVADCARTHLSSSCDLVTWVPLSRRRRRERGYDQAERIARTVAAELELPLLSTLEKIRDTRPQSGLTENSARRANVLGAYRCINSGAVEGKRVLLIDDVLTSGATASECARILRTAGAKTVFCATLARAR